MANKSECERFLQGEFGSTNQNSGIAVPPAAGTVWESREAIIIPKHAHQCATLGCVQSVRTKGRPWCRSCAAKHRRKPEPRHFRTVGSILHWAWGWLRGRESPAIKQRKSRLNKFNGKLLSRGDAIEIFPERDGLTETYTVRRYSPFVDKDKS